MYDISVSSPYVCCVYSKSSTEREKEESLTRKCLEIGLDLDCNDLASECPSSLLQILASSQEAQPPSGSLFLAVTLLGLLCKFYFMPAQIRNAVFDDFPTTLNPAV